MIQTPWPQPRWYLPAFSFLVGSLHFENTHLLLAPCWVRPFVSVSLHVSLLCCSGPHVQSPAFHPAPHGTAVLKPALLSGTGALFVPHGTCTDSVREALPLWGVVTERVCFLVSFVRHGLLVSVEAHGRGQMCTSGHTSALML